MDWETRKGSRETYWRLLWPWSWIEQRTIKLHRWTINELWGQIKHPTLEDICLLITELSISEQATDSTFSAEEIVLCKLDLQQAFTLQQASRQVTSNILEWKWQMFFLCGMFGWTGTPAAFQVLNRAIVDVLEYKIKGIYVDDIIIATRKKNVNSDIEATNKVCCSLLVTSSGRTICNLMVPGTPGVQNTFKRCRKAKVRIRKIEWLQRRAEEG